MLALSSHPSIGGRVKLYLLFLMVRPLRVFIVRLVRLNTIAMHHSEAATFLHRPLISPELGLYCKACNATAVAQRQVASPQCLAQEHVGK